MKKKDVLITCALRKEIKGQLKDYNILYTGVGKVNASFSLTNYCAKHPTPSLVINYGTAGSVNIAIGKLVDCTYFSQRDMDVRALGFLKGTTPLEKGIPPILDFSFTWDLLQQLKLSYQPKNYLCSSGDSLVINEEQGDNNKNANIVDMEAYALAKVCYFLTIPFISFKYISDAANKNAPKDWQKNVSKGIKKFQQEVLAFI